MRVEFIQRGAFLVGQVDGKDAGVNIRLFENGSGELRILDGNETETVNGVAFKGLFRRPGMGRTYMLGKITKAQIGIVTGVRKVPARKARKRAPAK